MLTYLIIFLSSLVLIVAMLGARILYRNLHDGHFFHKLVTHRARKADWHLKERFEQFSHAMRRYLSYFNKKTFSFLICVTIEKIEHYFHKMTTFVKNKFPHHK